MITQERLKELFYYNPSFGIFVRIKKTGTKGVIGDIAGYSQPSGYVRIGIDKKIYLAHRLAFLYVTGVMPSRDVDHANRVKTDNSWSNLRDVSASVNLQNQSLNKRSKSGIPGVVMYDNLKKWKVSITVLKSLKHLGYFDDFFEACCARKSAEVKYGFHPNHGR